MISFTDSSEKPDGWEYKKQEAAYEQTSEVGKCTCDMNYKRHRDAVSE